MAESLILIVLVVALGAAGLLLRERARGHTARWVALLRSIHPGASVGADGEEAEVTIGGRRITVAAKGDRLAVGTVLPEPPLPWHLAARAIGDGPLIAELFAGDLETADGAIELGLPRRTLHARQLRHAIARVASLADALEALPMAEAMARHLLDFTPEAERAAAFEALILHFPDAPVTRQCALVCRDAAETPALAERAEAWLRGEVG